jgi:FtsX-like permease family
MRAVLRVAVHAIRARWRGWALLALLVAVGGGAVLAAAAGAWRTSSAYPRFLQASNASDVLASPAGTGLGGYYQALAKLPGVAAVALAVGLNIQPAGRGEGGSVAEVAADGQLWHRVDVPRVLSGRLPRAGRAGEIAIDQNGAALLRLHVGSMLPMVALPNLPPGAKPSAATTPRLTERVVGIVVTRSSVDPVTDIDKVPVIVATPAAGAGRLQRSLAGFCQTVQQSTCVVADQRPNGVTNFARIDGIPEVLALLLAVLGVAVLGQVMVVSGRRRRRDLATLKTLGLVRRQVQATVAWQATILTGLALLAGLPLGIAVGRWAWALFSNGLGVPPGALIPVPFVLLMIPAALLAANAVACWPARAAARLSPARVLRAE